MNYYKDYFVMQDGAACRGIVHTVVSGDNLYRLSRLYGVPLDAIFEANPQTDVYNLKIGSRLCIPMNSMSLETEPNCRAVVVEKTQRLSKFLEKQAVSLSDYEKCNPEVQPLMLKAGEKVNLPRRIKQGNMT